MTYLLPFTEEQFVKGLLICFVVVALLPWLYVGLELSIPEEPFNYILVISGIITSITIIPIYFIAGFSYNWDLFYLSHWPDIQFRKPKKELKI